MTVAEQLDASQRVFTGVVVATEIIEGESARPVHRATLRVRSVWKGDATTHLLVDTMPVASCDMVLEHGAGYLVYAEPGEKEGIFRTHECFRTQRVSMATDDLVELGEPLFALDAETESWSALKARY